MIETMEDFEKPKSESRKVSLSKAAIAVILVGALSYFVGEYRGFNKGSKEGFADGRLSGMEVGIQAMEKMSNAHDFEEYDPTNPIPDMRPELKNRFKHPATFDSVPDMNDQTMSDIRRELATDKARDKAIEGDVVPYINY